MASASLTVDASPQARACILVVDDEVLIRLVIADALRDEGYAVVEAASGDEAYELLSAGVPADLLITDIQMPGRMDGIALARAARELRPELLIVFSSAQVAASEAVADVAAGFLAKPYSTAPLLRLAHRLLGA